MERDQAVRLTQNLLKKMVENNGSDLFITAEFPPAIKIDGTIRPFADRPLTSAQSSLIDAQTSRSFVMVSCGMVTVAPRS